MTGLSIMFFDFFTPFRIILLRSFDSPIVYFIRLPDPVATTREEGNNYGFPAWVVGVGADGLLTPILQSAHTHLQKRIWLLFDLRRQHRPEFRILLGKRSFGTIFILHGGSSFSSV
jgi:hypothetical protein